MSWDTIENLKKHPNFENVLEKLYDRKFKTLKIVHNLSEFLKALSINEGDILKSMLIKFACEAVDAARGSLLLKDEIHKELYYYDTTIFEDGRPVLENFNNMLKDIRIKEGKNQINATIELNNVFLVPDIKKYKHYDDTVDEILKQKIASLICVPIKVDNELIGILELVNTQGRRKFDEADVEAITIIVNLATATMENAKLFKWAISDGLTQIYNIHFFKRILEQEIKKVSRYGGSLSLIMLDLDKFKNINDTYGHQVGDLVLRNFSSIIRNNIREEIDIPGRYGGDEFVILLPNTKLNGALKVCERLQELIRSTEIKSNGNIIKYTSSIGVVEYIKGASLEELIEAVDKAMYKSKNSGRNRISSLEKY